MSLRSNLLKEVHKGIEGKNGSIPFPIAKLDQYIEIAKNTDYLLVSDTGGGKSSLAQDMILNILDWYYINKTEDIKLSIIYFGMERKQYMYSAKWISRMVFLQEGIYIAPKKILGRKRKRDSQTGRLTAAYDLLTKEELEKVEKYSQIFDLWEQDEVFTCIEGTHNATGIKIYIDNFAKRHGCIIPRKDGPLEKPTYESIHPNHIVLIVTDYVGIIDIEKDVLTGQRKQKLDKYSENTRKIRDLYGFSPINIQQLSRNLSDVNRMKTGDLKPKLADIADTSDLARDADVVLGLLDIYSYIGPDVDKDPLGYDLHKLKDVEGTKYYRSLHILKNSFDASGISMGLAFYPQIGVVKAMPKIARDMTDADYLSITNGSYFLT